MSGLFMLSFQVYENINERVSYRLWRLESRHCTCNIFMKYTLIVPGTKKKSREVASGLSRQEWCQKRAKRNVIPCALCSDSSISATYIIIVLLVLRVYRVESFTISLLMCAFVCTYRQIQSLARQIWVPVLPYPETHISEYWMGVHTLEHNIKIHGLL